MLLRLRCAHLLAVHAQRQNRLELIQHAEVSISYVQFRLRSTDLSTSWDQLPCAFDVINTALCNFIGNVFTASELTRGILACWKVIEAWLSTRAFGTSQIPKEGWLQTVNEHTDNWLYVIECIALPLVVCHFVGSLHNQQNIPGSITSQHKDTPYQDILVETMTKMGINQCSGQARTILYKGIFQRASGLLH